MATGMFLDLISHLAYAVAGSVITVAAILWRDHKSREHAKSLADSQAARDKLAGVRPDLDMLAESAGQVERELRANRHDVRFDGWQRVWAAIARLEVGGLLNVAATATDMLSEVRAYEMEIVVRQDLVSRMPRDGGPLDPVIGRQVKEQNETVKAARERTGSAAAQVKREVYSVIAGLESGDLTTER